MSSVLVSCGICQEEFDNEVTFTDHFLQAHTSDKNDSEDEEPTILETENKAEDLKRSQIISKGCDERPIPTLNNNNVNLRLFTLVSDKTVSNAPTKIIVNSGNFSAPQVSYNVSGGQTISLSSLVDIFNNTNYSDLLSKSQNQQICPPQKIVVPTKKVKNSLSSESSDSPKIRISSVEGNVTNLEEYAPKINNSKNLQLKVFSFGNTAPTVNSSKSSGLIINTSDTQHSLKNGNETSVEKSSEDCRSKQTLKNTTNKILLKYFGNTAPTVYTSRNSEMKVNAPDTQHTLKNGNETSADKTSEDCSSKQTLKNTTNKILLKYFGNTAPTVYTSRNSEMKVNIPDTQHMLKNGNETSEDCSSKQTLKNTTNKILLKYFGNTAPTVNTSRNSEMKVNTPDTQHTLKNGNETSVDKSSEDCSSKQTSNNPANKILIFKYPLPNNSKVEKIHTLNSPENSSTCVAESKIKNSKYSELFQNACDICGDIKPKRRDLAHHILLHIGAMPYFCTSCHFACISKLRFQQHIFNHYGPQKFKNHNYWLFNRNNKHQCEECEKCFSQWADLVFHYTNHILVMPYQCHECKMYFSEMRDFQIHSHLHKVGNNRCELCDVFFSIKPRLLDHVLEHNRTKYFRKFRHIHWNDGISQIQDPYSVVRDSASYYQGTFWKKFNWHPKDADFENHDRFEIMMELCKSDVNYGENESEIDVGEEDVSHLCEVSLEVINDETQIKLDVSSDPSSKSYEDKNHTAQISENLNQQKTLRKTRAAKSKTRVSNKTVDAPSIKFVNDSSVKENIAVKTNSNTVEEFSSLGVEPTCGYNINEEAAVKNVVKQGNIVEKFSPSKIRHNLESDVSEISNLKTLRVKLIKLPPEVTDLKSYRRYADRQRRKLARLKWRKYAEMKKSNPNARHENKRFNLRGSKNNTEPINLSSEKEIVSNSNSELQQDSDEKNARESVPLEGDNSSHKKRKSVSSLNIEQPEENRMIEKEKHSSPETPTRAPETPNIVLDDSDLSINKNAENSERIAGLKSNIITENEKNFTNSTEKTKSKSSNNYKKHIEIKKKELPAEKESSGKNDKQIQPKDGKQTVTKSKKHLKKKETTALQRNSKKIKFLESPSNQNIETKISDDSNSESEPILKKVSKNDSDSLLDIKNCSDFETVNETLKYSKSNINLTEKISREKKTHVESKSSKDDETETASSKIKKMNCKSLDNPESRMTLRNKVSQENKSELSELKSNEDYEIKGKETDSSEGDETDGGTLKKKTNLIDEVSNERVSNLIKFKNNNYVDTKGEESAPSKSKKRNGEELPNHSRKTTLKNGVTTEDSIDLLESKSISDVDTKRKPKKTDLEPLDNLKSKTTLKNRVFQKKKVNFFESKNNRDFETKQKISARSKSNEINTKACDNLMHETNFTDKVLSENEGECLESKSSKDNETEKDACEDFNSELFPLHEISHEMIVVSKSSRKAEIKKKKSPNSKKKRKFNQDKPTDKNVNSSDDKIAEHSTYVVKEETVTIESPLRSVKSKRTRKRSKSCDLDSSKQKTDVVNECETDGDPNSPINIQRKIITLDHNYHVNNQCVDENPLEDSSNSLTKASTILTDHSKPQVLKNSVFSSVKSSFIKNHKKIPSSQRPKKPNKLCNKKFLKKKLLNKVHTSVLKSKIQFLKSKARSQKVTVDLVRLPDYIYLKHLKTKPIMLSNILPVISSVTSVSAASDGLGTENSAFHVNFQSVFNAEHNYSRPFNGSVRYDERDSDSESTWSAYSNNASD